MYSERRDSPINAMSNEPIIITYLNHDILTACMWYDVICSAIQGKRELGEVIHTYKHSQLFNFPKYFVCEDVCVCFSAQTNIYTRFFFLYSINVYILPEKQIHF